MTPAAAPPAGPPRRGWLQRIGLGRPELRAWAMYDWANSAFMTTIIGAVFPIYFLEVAASNLAPSVAQFRYALATTAGLTFVALLSPILGALADTRGAKKGFLGLFVALGVVSTCAMVAIGPGDWRLAAALFILGNIAISGGFAFYDSLLPHIAGPDEIDRVSTAGYALGYLGGGLLLAVNLLWILRPGWFGLPDAGAASRLSFLSVGVWWGLFSIPLFRRVPEPAVRLEEGERELGGPTRIAVVRLRHSFTELRRYPQAALMLAAFLLYSDGINTIIRLATTYGTEIGIGPTHMIAAFLIVQFVGIPFALLFGQFAGRIGARPAIFVSLAVYFGITTVAYFMRTAAHFYALAILVGTVQGGSQALSRSLFASMIPAHKSSEFFAFFGIFEKFSGILGPALFALVLGLTGTSRLAILSVAFFFAAGAALLSLVDVEAGQRRVREEQG
ncbi:MAG: oxalate/formate antiporter family transporter [Acidobacteria bacterium]|nr:oxalate/formate antiporter family transporter [Acidobacteriota bacterium]